MCSYGSSCSSVHLQKKESVADQLCIVHNRLWGLLAYTVELRQAYRRLYMLDLNP